MRALIQRVSTASVEIEGETTGKIGRGLLVLLGITQDDKETDIEWIVKKISQLRVFRDEAGKMNLSVQDIQGDILLISQFTLFADSAKGNRPSYIRSAHPDIAIPLYEQTIRALNTVLDGRVSTGIFGADMKVSLINDGPVTIMLDSANPGL